MREKRGSVFVGRAGELLLTLEPDPLPQNTAAKKCYFLLLAYFAGIHLVKHRCLALGGILGDCHGERY